jgi:hypothetical protein
MSTHGFGLPCIFRRCFAAYFIEAVHPISGASLATAFRTSQNMLLLGALIPRLAGFHLVAFKIVFGGVLPKTTLAHFPAE